MDTKTYNHRVAMMVTTQIIMDVEAENDLDSIKKVALEHYFQGTGNQEEGVSFPNTVILYPWLEEGQTPPEGSAYPKPTNLFLTEDDFDNEEPEDEGDAQVVNLF